VRRETKTKTKTGLDQLSQKTATAALPFQLIWNTRMVTNSPCGDGVIVPVKTHLLSQS
jgi:hypothetical protein